MSNLFPVSDEDLFLAFDLFAQRYNIKPPETPGQQKAVALLIGAFIAGARVFQSIQEEREARLPEFALPGVDFDLTDFLRRTKK